MNKLNELPRGFGAFPALEVLDLTYNNLSETSFPGNFFMMGKKKKTSHQKPLFNFFLETLRALYLGDNDLEYFPPEIKQLKNLQIVSKKKPTSQDTT